MTPLDGMKHANTDPGQTVIRGKVEAVEMDAARRATRRRRCELDQAGDSGIRWYRMITAQLRPMHTSIACANRFTLHITEDEQQERRIQRVDIVSQMLQQKMIGEPKCKKGRHATVTSDYSPGVARS